MRATNIGIALLAVGALTIAAAYAATMITGSPPAWASWAVAFGGAASPVGLFVIGAASRGPVSPAIAVLFLALFVVIFGSFGAALALPANEGARGAIFLGLPVRLAIVFYGVGFLPLLALPVAFGLTFEKGKSP